MISGAGVNITVHVGKYGVLLVDTPQPCRGAARDGGDSKAVEPADPVGHQHQQQPRAGGWKRGARGPVHRTGGGGAPFGFVGLGRPSIVAHENVLNRLSNPPAGGAPAAA